MQDGQERRLAVWSRIAAREKSFTVGPKTSEVFQVRYEGRKSYRRKEQAIESEGQNDTCIQCIVDFLKVPSAKK